MKTKLNKYQIEGRNRLRNEALKHYKNGLSYRKIGFIMGKSHEWARQAIKSFAQV